MRKILLSLTAASALVAAASVAPASAMTAGTASSTGQTRSGEPGVDCREAD